MRKEKGRIKLINYVDAKLESFIKNLQIKENIEIK